MIKTCINTKQIVELADNVVLFLFGCEDSLDKAKEQFNNVFKKNTQDLEAFLAKMPEIKEKLAKDLQFFFDGDPAADSTDEILATYPGYQAVVYHRIAHVLYQLGHKVEARVISEHAHFLTGIDIHPGATIGCPFFIDHGTGVVIGETAIVGNYVKIYQGVTLGALSLAKGHELKGQKRHPTIGNNVTIYANATILGGDVTIGDYSVIGSNVFLLESIPENCSVTLPKPELVIRKKK